MALFLSRPICAAVLMCALAGCSSDPTLYSLAPVMNGVAQAGGPSVVEVRTPVVSAQLDRDTIVKASRDYQLKLAHGDTWSEPLADMVGHTLATDLAARLPGTTVFTQNDAVATTPSAYVELTLTDFQEDANGHGILRGSLSVHPAISGVGPVLTTPLTLDADPHGDGTGRLVASLSALLGGVADTAAVQVRGLPDTAAQRAIQRASAGAQ